MSYLYLHRVEEDESGNVRFEFRPNFTARYSASRNSLKEAKEQAVAEIEKQAELCFIVSILGDLREIVISAERDTHQAHDLQGITAAFNRIHEKITRIQEGSFPSSHFPILSSHQTPNE